MSRRLDALLGGALIVGMGTMPLFYHFELNEEFTKAYNITNQWGLVDSLEAAIAALAVSLLCRGIAGNSIKWCAIGWLVGAFSFFIKPSGLLVMITLMGVASLELILHFFGNGSSRRAILKFVASVYLIGFSVFGVALWMAFGGKLWSGSGGNGRLGESIENNNSPGRFVVRRPLNWVDTPGLRAEELVRSDFFLLENVRPDGTGEATAVSSWSEEVERFKQFAYSERGVDRNGAS